METVVTEGNVRTIETVSERTVSSKTVVQRTANTNSTQVNKYDAEGNLKSSTEADKESWEERDTKTYEWSKPNDRPPTPSTTDGTVAVAGSDLSVEKFLQDGPPSDGATLVMTTSENVPGVQWSGTTVEQRNLPVVATSGDVSTIAADTTKPNVNPDQPTPKPVASNETANINANESVAGEVASVSAAEVQASQRITTHVQGESSSRSGEVVWITETSKKPSPATNSAAEAGVTAAILPTNAQSPSVETAVTVQQTPPSAVQQPQLQHSLSVEERRRKRCIENRARKAAVVSAGIALTSA